MTETHKIGKQNFYFKFDSEESAFSVQGELSDIIKNELNPAIDSIFTSLSLPSKTIRIPELTVDLGIIHISDFKYQILTKLKEQLHLELSAEIISIRNYANSTNQIVDQSEEYLEIIVHYLRYGIMPLSFHRKMILDDIIGAIMEKEINEFIVFLRKNSLNSLIRHRLIKQFRDDKLIKLIHKLEPTNASFIVSYAIDIQKKQEQEPIEKMNEPDFRTLKWDVIFQFLLTDRGSHFNQKSFIKYTISNFAAHFNKSYSEVLSLLYSNNQGLNYTAQHTSLPGIINELRSEHETVVLRSNIKHSENQIEIDKYFELFRGIFRDFSIPKENVFGDADFDLLEKHYKQRLKDVILKEGKSRKKRELITKLFSTKQIIRIIRIIEPVNADFIIDYTADIKYTKQKENYFQSGTKDFSNNIWNFVFTFLLEERGSVFNKKQFIKSTIQQMAAHMNTDYSSILSLLGSSVHFPKTGITNRAIFSSLLSELENEMIEEQKLRKAPTKQAKQYLESFHIFENLQFLFKTGTLPWEPIRVINVKTPTNLLKTLRENNPVLYRKLLIQFKNSGSLVQSLIKIEDEDFYIELIRAMQEVFFSVSVNDSEIFAKTVKHFANNSGGKFIVYTQVIENIIMNHPIDFDKIGHKKGVEMKLIKFMAPEYIAGIQDPKILSSYINHIVNKKIFVNKNEILTLLFQSFINKFPVEYYFFLQKIDKGYNKFKFLNSVPFSIGEKYIQPYFEDIATHEKGETKKDELHEQHQDEPELKQYIKKDIEKLTITKEQRELVFSILQGNEKGSTKVSTYVLVNLLEELINKEPDEIFKIVFQNISNPKTYENVSKTFPEQLLIKLLFIIQPTRFRKIYELNDILWYIAEKKLILKPGETITQRKWMFIFFYINKLKTNQFSYYNFIYHFIKYICIFQKKLAFQESIDLLYSQVKLNKTIDNKNKQFIISELKTLQKDKAPQKVKISNHSLKIEDKLGYSPEPPIEVNRDNNEEEEFKESVYINNAGLVLAAPYIPALFSRLEYMDMGDFKSLQHKRRAVHLLQYVIDGSTCNPEYKLVLNKILCGLKTGVPLDLEIEITQKEEEITLQLLSGIIQNWKAIGNTSIEGLRESFFQRDGRLMLKENGWHLQVEKRTFDMLLDQIPWSISPVKYSWMKNIVHVQWR